ncbi:uncharacterized protein LOC130102416 [Rhinichthys klamathensis goyatoka]|uniref:uncharacterized protein LOC130102416 n=1 Tax=Rhinichthys klamathensis goyatoka TaxID=3034132 RepID=UPI0024B4F1A6|nr:uncharacterized protein LOC130102416 [Rhinichthys klamathensis goyatoka]
MAESTRHITIQRGDSLPELQQCNKCCSYYHCPFCSASVFKPAKLVKLKSHVQIHFNKAVVYGGFTIHRCGLGCRTALHYHCPYCDTTVLRRRDFETHVQVCKNKPLPTSTTILSPATAALTTPSAATLTTPHRVRVQPVIKKKCPVCNILINRKNFKKHIDRKHTEQPIQDIIATFHLVSQCIDRTNGIFTVLKVTKGHSVPLHIQLKTWGEHHKVICESHECQVNMEVAQRSGLSSYQCKHIRSVTYCTSSAEPVSLKEEILTEMVKAKWFSNEKKKICLTHQQLANSSCIPLSVQTSIGTPETKKLISVFEPNVSYYSRLGRVMVVYDSKLNTWHCPCAKLRRSCLHKYIAKWHLFQTQRELFRTVFSREESPLKGPHAQSEENDFREDSPVYPPKDLGLKNMVSYILQHKKIPVDLPDDVHAPSPDKDYPRNLCPDESICQSCPGVVPLSDPILITKKAKILTNWSIIEDIATYCKQCPLCGMFYRYQEWKDHLHNFNDHIILAIPLCLTLRSLLQLSGGAQNPFVVKPMYHFWAPWIGKNTCRSDIVLNTEYEKLHSSKSASETAEITVTEERLKEELQKQKVNVIRKLCKECGLDSTGSRSDLLLRLSNEMKSRQTYDKIFEKICGASGGWGVIMCPCGIVYSLKSNLRAESPRDFADLLFSWKHLPNIIIYDFARGLATHANLRAPESIPIRPYEGRLAEPNEENIKLAKSGNLKVSLPWLEEKMSVSDPQGHPLTGSSDHYVLSDRFHESNSKDSRDVLRKITIVPQLAGKINSQVAEQLFSKMRKNNYFLNMSQPSTHLFQMRTIIHHYNENKNNKVRTRLMKTFGSKLVKNMHGQAVLENSDISTEEPVPIDIEMEDTTLTSTMVPTSTGNEIVCSIEHLFASRVCWDCLPSHRQSAMLDWALGTDDPDETIGKVGNLVLRRKDFRTLGLNELLEATIANSCLEVIALVAKEHVSFCKAANLK